MRAPWVVVLLAGCMDGLPAEGPQAVPHTAACTALEGLSFQSVQPGECGLGPDGPTSCAWQLRFRAADATRSLFTWSHSDVEETGYVACTGGAIQTLGAQPGFRYEGTFDGRDPRLAGSSAERRSGSVDDGKLDLQWDDRAYVLAP